MEKKTLLEVRNVIDDIKSKGINEEYIRELYRLLGNKEIPLVIDESAIKSAVFNSMDMTITASVEKSNNWTKRIIDESLERFNVRNIELARAYMFVALFAHEIEHSNQKLIADGRKEINYDFKRKVYHDIFEILRVNKYIVIPRLSLIIGAGKLIRYRENEYNMILERNAALEGHNMAALVAGEAKDNDLLPYLISVRNIFLMQGYYESGEGVLKYTYRMLDMMKKYNKLDIPTNLSVAEKIKEGLELDEDERKVSLLTMKKYIDFK